MRRPLVIAALTSLAVAFGCDRYPYAVPGGDGRVGSVTDSTLTGPPPVQGYEVVNTYPHDASAYTQGLVFRDGVFYEGTGQHPYFGPGVSQNGRSSLRKVDVETGSVLQSTTLPVQYFGEGIIDVGDEIFQLTWLSHTGFVYDLETFAVKREFTYATEGWGITHDGNRFIMSDGTATLTFRDASLAVIGSVQVRDDRGPVWNLNELEYVDGEIYANVYLTNRIARVNPLTGQVIAWIDLSGILPAEDRPSEAGAVLNGIAYDPDSGRLFVTGKLWPKLFEIRLKD